MGDIKKKRKKYSRPRKLYSKIRIASEGEIVKKYGLKNMREIWKAKSKVSEIRRKAKALIGKDPALQKKFFEMLRKMGFNVSSIADVLVLSEIDWIERRLQTFLVKKKLAKTFDQSRQMIVHKKVMVDGRIVNIPSFFITKDLEDKITIKVDKEENN